MLPPRWLELPQPVLKALEPALEVGRFRAGKPLFDQGDPASKLFVVAEGCVRLFRVEPDGREVTVGVIEEGSLFGEESLLADENYRVFAETISRSRIVAIQREKLQQLKRRFPALRRHLLAEMVLRLRASQNFYAQLRFAEVSQRLARVLCKHMKPGLEGIEVTLSHRQLGYLIGSNRDTVTRALGELALRGILEINYRRLVILDPEALRRLAGEPYGAAQERS